MSALILASSTSSSQFVETSRRASPLLPQADNVPCSTVLGTTGIYVQIRRWSSICGLTAMIGEGLAALILFLTWSGNLDIQEDVGDDICRWGISLSTLVCVFALWKYHALWWDERWSRKCGSSILHSVPRCRLLHASFRIKCILAVETCVLLIHPPPLVHLSTSAVCNLCMAMSLRFWFLARMLRDTNPEHVVATKQRRFLGPHASHQQIPWAFAMRATFARKPWEFLFWLISVGYLLFSVFLWVAERHEQPDQFDLFDSFWFAMVTMTTVGYGDRYPHTYLGKSVALGGCIFGINALALLVNVVTTHFTLSHREHYLIQSIDMSKATCAERDAAARIIQFWWRTRRRGLLNRGGDVSRLSRCLNACCGTYRAVRTSMFGSSLVGALRRWRQERKRLSEQLAAADFQRETTQRLESLAHGQKLILDRLAQLEVSLRRIEQGSSNDTRMS